jgi:NTP pyrophosphatase (non-canonical NTP hydrolase)
MIQDQILHAIVKERHNQDEKWGIQQHSHGVWYIILGEEVGEVARSILENDSQERVREELIQCAAVCVAWLEDMSA